MQSAQARHEAAMLTQARQHTAAQEAASQQAGAKQQVYKQEMHALLREAQTRQAEAEQRLSEAGAAMERCEAGAAAARAARDAEQELRAVLLVRHAAEKHQLQDEIECHKRAAESSSAAEAALRSANVSLLERLSAVQGAAGTTERRPELRVVESERATADAGAQSPLGRHMRAASNDGEGHMAQRTCSSEALRLFC